MAENDRPELTSDERAEKKRLADLIKKHAQKWQANHPGQGKLTQGKLGELIGELRGEDPLTQGAVWHYISEKSDTKLNAGIVQAVAFILGFDVGEVSERFRPKLYTMPAASELDAAIWAELSRLPLSTKQFFLAQIAAVADSIEDSNPAR